MSAVPAQPWRTPPPSATVMELLDRAQASLLHASQAGEVGERYVLAHLAGFEGVDHPVLLGHAPDPLVALDAHFLPISGH